MTEKEAISYLEIEKISAEETSVGKIKIQMCDEAIKALREVQEYRKIGTVEECREAVEKQKPNKCVKDSCPDHTHYKCPSCGRIQKTEYERQIFGCILNYCSNCGQKLDQEEE